LLSVGVTIALAGCDLVFRLDTLQPQDGASAGDDSIGNGDGTVVETCAYMASPSQLVVTGVTPYRDLSVVGETAMVYGIVGTTLRYGALLSNAGQLTYDPGDADLVSVGWSQAHLVPDPAPSPLLDASKAIGGGMVGVSRYHLEAGVGWVEDAPTASALVLTDATERFGNARDIAGTRYYVTTRRKNMLDPDTILALRTYDLSHSPTLGTDAKMADINTAQIPDLGVITRDGLTLIYSARSFAVVNYDLFVSHRTTLTEPFPIGTPLDALNTANEDEREPWIDATCDRLYFRRGSAIEVNGGIGSTFWVAQRTP
jgi:hypothetical protein